MYQQKPTRQLAEHVRNNMALEFADVRENTRSFIVTGECPVYGTRIMMDPENADEPFTREIDASKETYRSPVKIIFRKDRAADQFTLQTPGYAREMKRDGHYAALEEEVVEALDSFASEPHTVYRSTGSAIEARCKEWIATEPDKPGAKDRLRRANPYGVTTEETL